MRKILPFPQQRQVFSDDCGADAATCCIVATKYDTREDKVLALARTTADGTETEGVLAALDYYGVLFCAAERMAVSELLVAIAAGHPVILTLQAYRDDPTKSYADDWEDGHYVVAIGFDTERYEIIFEDPSSYCRTYLGCDELEERWHDVAADGTKLLQWGCTILSPITFVPDECKRME